MFLVNSFTDCVSLLTKYKLVVTVLSNFNSEFVNYHLNDSMNNDLVIQILEITNKKLKVFPKSDY